MTADLFTLGLEVKSDGVATASDRLNALSSAGKNAEDGASKLSSTFDKLGYSLSTLQDLMVKAASALALMKLAEFAKECAMLTARYDTLGVVMTQVGKTAGYTSTMMLDFQKGLQKTGISAIEARQGMILMGQAQIDFTKSSTLARIAQNAAVVGNINSSEAFNRMLTGLATGQSVMLHHLGLMTNFETAYIKAANAAGKTTKDLTETEKAAIRVNEVIRAGAGIAGVYEASLGTVGKQISSLPRYFNDLKVALGEMGQGILFSIVSTLTDSLKFLVHNIEAVTAAIQFMIGLGMLVFLGNVVDKIATYNAALRLQAVTTLAAAEAEVARTAALVAEAEVEVINTAASTQGAAAAVQHTLATEANALATAELATVQKGATISAQLLTGSTTLLNGALAMVGGVLGLITIAVGAAAVAWVKLCEAEERHNTNMSAAQNAGDFSQLRQKTDELKRLNDEREKADKTPAEKVKTSEEELQKKINAAIKDNIDLRKKQSTLQEKADGSIYAKKTLFGGLTELETINVKIRNNVNLIEHGKEQNAEWLAEQERGKRITDAQKAKTETPLPVTMQDDDEYSRLLKKSEEEHAKYLDDVRKRTEGADKNAMDIRLDAAKTEKDQLLLGERAYSELVLREHAALAQNIANLEYAKYQAAVAKLADIQAALAGKTHPDGTVGEGKIGNEIVGQAELNHARAEKEKAYTVMSAADTKAAIDKNELDNLGKKYEAIDKLALRELAIQAMEINGATTESQQQRDDLKYEKMWLDTHNMVLIVRAKELDLIIRTKGQEDARRNAANTVQDINTATKDIGISMIDDPAARKTAEIQAGYDKTQVLIQRERDAITSGNDAQIQAITDLTERKKAASDKDIALVNKLDAVELDTKKKLAANKQEDTASHWDTMLASAKKVAPQLAALDGFLAIQHKTYEADATDATKLSTKGKLEMTSDYVGAAGSMFTSLAATTDKTSRDGFESAKAFSIAAAVMDTASAIMKAYSLGPIAGTVAAVGIAAIGAIQIAKIASTSYKGGASAPSAPAGSFSGSSTGASAPGQSIGNAFVSVQDSQTYDSMKRLADASDNASVALTKVADGLTNISTMFSAGSVSGGISSKTPGFGSAANDTGAGLMSQWKDFNMGFVKGTLAGAAIGGTIGGWLGSVVGSAIGSVVGPLISAFGHGAWNKQYGGIALNMEGGQINNGQTWSQYQSNGGLFVGNKTKIAVDGQIDSEYIKALNDQVLRLQSTISRAAVVMGTTVDFANAQNVGMTLITSGKTAEEINKELVAYFEKIAGSLAQTTAGLKDYTYYGESAFDATVRLATALQSTNESFKLIGATLVEATMFGANFTYKLQDMMGGADKFATKMDKYFTSIFSTEEQAARKATQAQAAYTVAFTAMNAAFTDDATVAIPTTRAAFASLVSSLTSQFGDSTTMYTKSNGEVVTAGERAAALFAALMDVAEGFALVADKTEKYNADMTASALDLDVRMLRVDGLSAEADMIALVATQEAELTDYFKKGLDTGKLRIIQEKEYQATLKESIKNMGVVMTNLDGFITGQQSVLNALKSIKASDPSLTPLQKLTTAKSAYDDLRAKATAIIAPLGANATADQTTAYNLAVKNRNTALGQVGGAGQDYVTTASNYYGSGIGYQRIASQIMGELSAIGGMTGTDPTIAALDTQITWLEDIHQAIIDGDEKALRKLMTGSDASIGTNALLDAYLAEIQKITTTFTTEKGKQDQITTATNNLTVAQATADASLAALTGSDVKGATAQASIDKLGGSVRTVGSIAYMQQQIADKTSAQRTADSYASYYAGTPEGAVWGQSSTQLGTDIKTLLASVRTATTDLAQARLDVITYGNLHSTLYTTSQTDKQEVIRLTGMLHNLGVPGYATGSPYIPNDMTANIHQGELIMDRQSADVLRKYGIQVNGSADNREVVAELKELNVKSAAMERRLANIEVKARLVANA